MAGEHGTDWVEADGEMEQAKRKTGRRWLDETGKKSDGRETPLPVAPDRGSEETEITLEGVVTEEEEPGGGLHPPAAEAMML
ncbi:unnamed protein product [Boreogadus saida]